MPCSLDMAHSHNRACLPAAHAHRPCPSCCISLHVQPSKAAPVQTRTAAAPLLSAKLGACACPCLWGGIRRRLMSSMASMGRGSSPTRLTLMTCITTIMMHTPACMCLRGGTQHCAGQPACPAAPPSPPPHVLRAAAQSAPTAPCLVHPGSPAGGRREGEQQTGPAAAAAGVCSSEYAA